MNLAIPGIFTVAFLIAFSLFSTESPAIAEECEVVSALAISEDGRVMVECSLELKPAWVASAVGEPLAMKDYLPLSLGVENPDLQCEVTDIEAMATLANFQLLVRYPEVQSNCPFPASPDESIYHAQLPGGADAFLRIPSENHPDLVEFGCGDIVIPGTEISPLEFAIAQVGGDPHLVDVSNQVIEFRIAEQDCRSLIAFETKTNQQEELINSAKLTARLLELYRVKNGMYPVTLCQLYTGPDRVVAAVPRNPFEFEQNLCDSEAALPRPSGAIDYIPRKTEEGVSHYWLAILGQGIRVSPKTPLPSDIAVPLRAIHWIEPSVSSEPTLQKGD